MDDDLVFGGDSTSLVLRDIEGLQYHIYVDEATLDVNVTGITTTDVQTRVDDADLYFEQAGTAPILHQAGRYYRLGVTIDGALTATLIPQPLMSPSVGSGHMELSSYSSGFILKDANSDCWKYSMGDAGEFKQQLILCP